MEKFNQSNAYIPFWFLSVFVFVITKPFGHMQAIALQNSKDTAKSSNTDHFYWLIAIVGGAIIMTLLYVGWKKYKAGRLKQKRKNE